MEASRRDTTDEWVLPEKARPPLLSELEARIDHALATARSSEAAAIAVGSAALDAAEQARRSAELAEHAHDLVAERLAAQPVPAASPPGPVVPGPSQPAEPAASAALPKTMSPPSPNGPGAAGQAREEDPLHAFIVRADRISARLKRLESTPLSAAR